MKKTKIITIILGIILISLIAFLGIYVQKQNRMENVVKDYNLGMNLSGSRSVQLGVSNAENVVIKDAEGNIVEEELTDEQISEKGYTKQVTRVNADEVKTIENYKKSKKIIENRLKEFGVEEYLIKLNEENGLISIELPENSTTDYIVSKVGQASEFKMLDTETEEELMNNKDIKEVNVLYGNQNEETNDITVYLNFEFTKDGAKKLEGITKKYVKIEEVDEEITTEESTTNNEESTDETINEKTVTIKIDNQEAITTSFGEPITNGIIQLSIGVSSVNQEIIQNNIKTATTLASLLNNGKLPINYEITSNKYMLSNLQNIIDIAILIILGIVLILLVILFVKYRVLGLLCGISSFGLLAVLSLIIRYVNIYINIETFLAIIIIVLINISLLNNLLRRVKYAQEIKNAIREEFIKFFIKIIPVLIIAIVFSFINWNPIYNFGITLFWGLLLIAIYNYVITRTLILIKENK